MQKLILAAMLAVLSPVTALAQPVINAPFGEPVDEAMVEIDPRSVVEQYTGAFNARDVDRMESLMHPGIQIMEVSATGTDMVSEGYWAIVSHWLEHIEDADTPVLELTGWSQLDDYVTAIETSRLWLSLQFSVQKPELYTAEVNMLYLETLKLLNGLLGYVT